MKIIYPYFDNSTTDYARLRNVFEKSARRHMPDADLVCINLEPAKFLEDKHDLTTRAFISKINKLDSLSENAAIVADCDLFFTSSILSVFGELEFFGKSLGITVREDYKYPYNSGLFFVRCFWDIVPEVVNIWLRNTRTLYANMRQISSASFEIKRHGGVDQAALAATHHAQSKNIKTFPCLTYNACQGDWKHTSDETKVYHIKSGLRKIVLDPKKEHGELYLKAHTRVQEIARMWWAEEDR